MKGNRLQIRLDGPFFAASLGNSSTIALRNRQKLSSPSRIFASILQVRQAPRQDRAPCERATAVADQSSSVMNWRTCAATSVA